MDNLLPVCTNLSLIDMTPVDTVLLIMYDFYNSQRLVRKSLKIFGSCWLFSRIQSFFLPFYHFYPAFFFSWHFSYSHDIEYESLTSVYLLNSPGDFFFSVAMLNSSEPQNRSAVVSHFDSREWTLLFSKYAPHSCWLTNTHMHKHTCTHHHTQICSLSLCFTLT